MLFLKEGTTPTVLLGPYVLASDGDTEYTTGIANTAVQLSKNGAAFVSKSETTSTVHQDHGMHNCLLNATDTGTVGTLHIMTHVATTLPVYHEFFVVETNVYDALFASGADGFGTDGVTLATSQGLYAPSKAGDAMDLITDAVDAAALATDAVTEIANAMFPKTNTALSNVQFLMVLSSDHVTAATGLVPVMTRSIDGAAFAAKDAGTTIAEIANGMYQVDLATADTNGTIITYRFAVATADDTFLTIRYVT